MTTEILSSAELIEAWPALSNEERREGFLLLPRVDAEELFIRLDPRDALDLLLSLPPRERRLWTRLLPPDDMADLVQQAPPEEREALLAQLDDATRKDVAALLAYAEDEAGGLMNPRYARLRPEMSVDEAIRYLRRQSREHAETIYYAYVLDPQQRLLGAVSFRQLVTSPPDKTVRDVMRTDVVSVPEEMDQEAVSRLFAQHDFLAMPVVDAEGRMKGIVTADDIVDVVEEEATEDIQKIGGTAALDAPYLDVGLAQMFRKRAVWLAVIFLAQLLTTSVMGFYESELQRAAVLMLFIPLIISSGGNSGSQASTLVIRAISLGEVRLRDWWRVLAREAAVSLSLGVFLGLIGLVRVLLGSRLGEAFGDHAMLIGWTVAASLVGVVMWGSIVGAMLPFFLRRIGLDPASASAPFVATLVDVTGLVIYFNVSLAILRGVLL